MSSSNTNEMASMTVATVMLAISFVLLLLINGLQTWQRKRSGGNLQ